MRTFAHVAFATDQQTTVPQKTVGALQMDFQLTRLDVVEKNGKQKPSSLPICGCDTCFIWIPIIQTVSYVDYLLAQIESKQMMGL